METKEAENPEHVQGIKSSPEKQQMYIKEGVMQNRITEAGLYQIMRVIKYYTK